MKKIKRLRIVLVLVIIILSFILSLTVNAGNGKILWRKTNLDMDNHSQAAIGKDGTVYVAGVKDSVRGYLYAFAPDGSVKWKFRSNNLQVFGPAVDKEGTIYFVGEDAEFYALNRDGSLKWSTNIGDRAFMIPAIGPDGTIYVSNLKNRLYAFNKDGTEKWHISISTHSRRNPAVWHDGTIYVGTDNGRSLLALTPVGKTKWRVKAKGVITSPAIGPDGAIYIGDTRDNFYAVTPDGRVKWQKKFENEFVSAPVVGKGGIIYLINGGMGNKVYALNPEGSILWECETGDTKLRTPALANDGTIYTGSPNHTVFAINSDGTIKWKKHVDRGVTSSPQIGYDGTIYIGTEKSTYAIEGSSTGPMDSSWPLLGRNVRNTACIDEVSRLFDYSSEGSYYDNLVDNRVEVILKLKDSTDLKGIIVDYNRDNLFLLNKEENVIMVMRSSVAMVRVIRN